MVCPGGRGSPPAGVCRRAGWAELYREIAVDPATAQHPTSRHGVASGT